MIKITKGDLIELFDWLKCKYYTDIANKVNVDKQLYTKFFYELEDVLYRYFLFSATREHVFVKWEYDHLMIEHGGLEFYNEYMSTKRDDKIDDILNDK